ncbi:uncharacterized protein LOC127734002 [Mytilus californianus]|uniref:uncharacterized protein LOC127734002 n=1 Tax=Mytilus californianus TaxID=6549 RepID=UPI002247C5A8|nr:uncharacterized protein LOC127734002 [Mytilus californianus]
MKSKKRNFCTRRRQLFSLFWCLVFLYGLMLYEENEVQFNFIHINTKEKCVIPKVNPFDESILPFLWKPDPIVCPENTELVYIDEDEMIHINKSQTKGKQIECNYQSVIRKHLSDDEILFGTSVWFNVSRSAMMESDFAKVVCVFEGKIIYERLHYHIKKKQKYFESDNDSFSVLIFGVDSMSRLAAIRELPKTLSYLEKTLGAYVFNGFTKVGGNSYPNLMAMLTGNFSVPFSKTKFFDEQPFVWKKFSKRGAATMYSEDYPRLSTFNYVTRGFNDPPGDHYLRPFYLGINSKRKYQSTINDVLLFLEDKDITLGSTSTLCYGDRPKHVIQIDYFKRFLNKYKNSRKFAMSWLNEIGHEYVNFIKLGDADFYNFLVFLKEGGHLKRSILFFMSDHGTMIDKIRNTPIGRIEAKLPFLSIVLPTILKQKYPHIDQNLQTNINRLTSPLDLHKTLIDIATNSYNHHPKDTEAIQNRGISLFNEIPKDRTCADAHIPESSCACYTSEAIPTNNAVIEKITSFVVVTINTYLQTHRSKCALLTLKKIHEAKLIHSNLKHSKPGRKKAIWQYLYKPKLDKKQRYFILFEVMPSEGMFEVTTEITQTNNFIILDKIIRSNRYGNQSACIDDRDLKPYCYCK